MRFVVFNERRRFFSVFRRLFFFPTRTALAGASSSVEPSPLNNPACAPAKSYTHTHTHTQKHERNQTKEKSGFIRSRFVFVAFFSLHRRCRGRPSIIRGIGNEPPPSVERRPIENVKKKRERERERERDTEFHESPSERSETPKKSNQNKVGNQQHDSRHVTQNPKK